MRYDLDNSKQIVDYVYLANYEKRKNFHKSPEFLLQRVKNGEKLFLLFIHS